MWIFRILVLGVVVFAGCAAPAVRYYSLVPAAQAQIRPDTGAATTAREAVRLRVTHVPSQADRPQLLVRDPSADPAVQVLNDSLWVAPLSDEMQAALRDYVNRQLDTPDLDHLPGAAALPVRRIDVQITRFDLSWGEAVHLSASWTDREPGAAARICQARILLPADRSVADLVESARHALRALAAVILNRGLVSGVTDAEGVRQSGCT